MADRDVICKYCGKVYTFTTVNTTFNKFRGYAKDNMVSYARYYFCNMECLNMYKHCRSDRCCIHKIKK